ncbi:MAG: hypothetical protein RIT24_977 [Planctomycetota bacterium]
MEATPKSAESRASGVEAPSTDGLPRNPFRRLRLRALIDFGLRKSWMRRRPTVEYGAIGVVAHARSPCVMSARRWRQRRNLRNRSRGSRLRKPNSFRRSPLQRRPLVLVPPERAKASILRQSRSCSPVASASERHPSIASDSLRGDAAKASESAHAAAEQPPARQVASAQTSVRSLQSHCTSWSRVRRGHRRTSW